MPFVPKILHQTWKTSEVPERFKNFFESWKNFSKRNNFEHRLYTDKNLRDLIKKSFPRYLEAYDSFNKNIERVDFSRLVMMYVYGGIYADLDTYPKKDNLDHWLNKEKIILGREPEEHASAFGRKVMLCNAFMISPPGDDFWLKMMDFIIDNYGKSDDPVVNTGPMAMTLFLEKYPEHFKNIVITEPCIFFPLTSKQTVAKGCDIKDANVVHVWENSWVEPNKKIKILAFVFIILVVLGLIFLLNNRK